MEPAYIHPKAAELGALNALANPDCANLIDGGTGAAEQVLQESLFSSSTPSILSVPDLLSPSVAFIGVDNLSPDRNAQTEPVQVTDSMTGTSLGTQSIITVNSVYRPLFPNLSLTQNLTVTLLHELGHAVYNAYGPGISGIKQDGPTGFTFQSGFESLSLRHFWCGSELRQIFYRLRRERMC